MRELLGRIVSPFLDWPVEPKAVKKLSIGTALGLAELSLCLAANPLTRADFLRLVQKIDPHYELPPDVRKETV